MPSKNSPMKLEDCCLKVVAEHIDELQSKVSHLPYTLINKIYENRFDLKPKYPAFTTDFINPCTTKLDFPTQFASSLTLILQKIQTHCRNLIELDFTGMGMISSDQLQTLLKHLPNIRDINFTNTACDDLVLQTIGHYSCNLRRLNISDCCVSDRGIRFLHGNKTILVLNIKKNSVTPKGCWSILENLKNLREYANSCWPEIFNMLNIRFLSSQKCSTYNVEVIPNISEELEEPSHGIIALKIFPRLKHFYIGNQYNETQTDIYLPLKMSESRLTYLHLEFVTIDFEVISNLCPNLEILELDNCKIMENNIRFGNKFTPVFQHLRMLDLHSTPVDVVNLLTNTPNLQHLTLLFSLLTDDLLKNVLGWGLLQQLQVLILQFCDHITASGITELLKSRSPLNKLDICQCSCIKEKDFAAVQSYVRNENLDVCVTEFGI